MNPRSKLPAVASGIAFVIAGLTAAAGLLGSVVILPLALIPLCAAIGLARRRVWAAYGFAVYSLSPIFLAPLILSRQGRSGATIQFGVSVIWSLALATIFYFAGRALAREGAPRGLAWPWLVCTAMVTLPLLFLRPFVIPTGAMENTMLVGDRVLVQSFPRSTPARGDLFAVIYPVNRKQTFMKRIVGISGDHIRISNKVLFMNGAPLNEPYVIHKQKYVDSYRDQFPAQPNIPILPGARQMLANNVVNGELVVPPGKYFVLGDNRDESLDSRYWGFVSAGDLIGKPLLIYDSANETPEQIAKGGALQRVHTRWNRLFRPL